MSENNSNSNNAEESQWLDEMWDGGPQIGVVESAEDIIIQQKTGKIIIGGKEKEILEESLEILSKIYDEAVRSFEISHTLAFKDIAKSEKDAKDLIFIKRMELKYLSKWINVKMFLIAVEDLASVEGGKSRKSIKSRRSRKRKGAGDFFDTNDVMGHSIAQNNFLSSGGDGQPIQTTQEDYEKKKEDDIIMYINIIVLSTK